MTKRLALTLFIIGAFLALGIHYFMFEMRYMWYVSVDEARFMHTIYAAYLVAIVLLWTFFPSRLVVAVVSAFGLFFPHLFYAADARPLLGRSFDWQTFDWQTLGIAALPILLMVLATELRRRSRGR